MRWLSAILFSFLSATDPSRLLFSDLPGALGIAGLDSKGAALFVERLRDRLRTIGRAYPALLDDVEQQIRSVFGLSGTAQAAYQQLQQRAHVVQAVISDPKLKTFVLEACRDLAGRDWREGLARAVRDGLPPTHWKDAEHIHVRLGCGTSQVISFGWRNSRASKAAAARGACCGSGY